MTTPATPPGASTAASSPTDQERNGLTQPVQQSQAPEIRQPVTVETTPTRTTVEGAPPPPGWVDAPGKTVTVIFNPVSGTTDPEERKRAIEEALAEHGYRAQHLVTTKEHGARHFAEQALRDGVDLLAISGGDGTVVEAAGALIGTDVPLAVFPAGTGNLLSVNLGLPTTVPDAVHAALFGDRRQLDLGRLRLPDTGDEHYFAIIAGAGYDAAVMQGADREAKRRMGLLAYVWSALRNLNSEPVRTTLRLDGGTALVRMAKSVMVANMGRIQGGVDIVPDADPESGALQVAVLKADSLADWAQLALSAVTQRLEDERLVEYRRARRVEVEFDVPQPFQYDGEDLGTVRCYEAEIVPSAVTVMVPKDAPV